MAGIAESLHGVVCAYLEENHGGDLLGGELLLLAEVVNLNLGLAVVVDDLERPGLDVLLDGGVIETTADKTPMRENAVSHDALRGRSDLVNSLGVEDSVDGVHGSIVLSGLTDQTLLLGERDERRGGERTLLVGDDLDIATLVGGNARVGGTCSANDRSALNSSRVG
jgi:hypothetical protein